MNFKTNGKRLSWILLFTVIVFGLHAQGGIGINADSSPPDGSAMLDVKSTDKGMLVPRMTTAQRQAIVSPATGLLVFDSTTASFWFYEGTEWTELGANDGDWTKVSNGIYHNTGNVSVNTSAIDGNSNFYVYRPTSDYGADKAAIYGYRAGYSSEPDSGGIHWGTLGVDAAIKGFSNWGNKYTAGVAGHGYLDYPNSAGVMGGNRAGSVYGGLGFRDSTQIWAGYFQGDVRFSPQSGYDQELYLDIVREYSNQGEFGEWHELYVLPNARNTAPPHYDLYYLGDDTHHFDGLYCNNVNPETQLFINGNTIVTGSNDLGVGTALPGLKVHVKQEISNRAIRTEHHTTSDYWDTGVGVTTKNYKFYYNGFFRADISSTDGAYVQSSDRSLKTNVEYLEGVLPRILELKPARYHYKDVASAAAPKSHGFIAQEVATVFPEIIRYREDGKMALAYDDFSILAVRAIQEQQQQVQRLEEEVKELKIQNAALNAQSDRIERLEAALLKLQSQVAAETSFDE